MRLFIIGNGFDLANGLKTSYLDFRNFIKDENKRKENKEGEMIMDFYSDDDMFWSDFENNISNCDTKMANVIDEAYNLDVVYSNIPSAINNQLLNFIRHVFNTQKNKKPIITGINAEDYVFTFNYTDSPIYSYNVKMANYYAIHNSVGEVDFNLKDKLVVGHGKDGFAYDHNEYSNKSSYYYKFVEATTKPTKLIIDSDKTQEFLKTIKLANITEVVIFGCSFSRVDMPYFEKIIEVMENKVNYVVYYYSDRDKKAFEDNYSSFFSKVRYELRCSKGVLSI